VESRRTQAERSLATRTALVSAARELFAAQGFAGTGRDEIAARAGVTRGALYHHFGSKEALFRAVVEHLEEEMGQRIMAAAAKEPDVRLHLRAGCHAFLDACTSDPAVRRIIILEAPVVLGWDVWREIDVRHGVALIAAGLAAALDGPPPGNASIETLATLLLGTLNEAAMLVATAPKPRVARAQVGAAVDMIIDRITAPVT
jgi:AcrR family transcriptional regulator